MSFRRYAMAMGAVTLASLVGLTAAAGDVPYPDIPKGQGETCVEDTDFMRRNHMSLLMHQRDDTMRKGIRSEQHSLKECLDCHAVPGSDSIPVTVEDPKHFCRSCHDYAAVKIDCFQCHASRPEQEVVAEAREE
jgi:predicted CXXCH cytochrome family protein